MIQKQAGTSKIVSRRSFLATSSMVIAGLPWGQPCSSQAEPSEPIRFGIITDTHFADREPAGTRYYRDSLEKMLSSVQQMNEMKLDFLAELGDFKDQDETPTEERTLSHLRRIEEAFSQFQGPRFHVLGNHDMDSISKSQFLSQVKNTGVPGDRSYYSFDLKGLHGVVLDGNYLGDGKDYDHGNFVWTDANIPPAQLDWLKQDLATASTPCVVFIHQRLDGEGDLFINNAAEVRTILEQSGKVRLVLQGHHHEGGFSQIQGIPYYTLKATVEGPGLENKSFAIVEIEAAGKITITGYGQAVSQMDL